MHKCEQIQHSKAYNHHPKFTAVYWLGKSSSIKSFVLNKARYIPLHELSPCKLHTEYLQLLKKTDEKNASPLPVGTDWLIYLWSLTDPRYTSCITHPHFKPTHFNPEDMEVSGSSQMLMYIYLKPWRSQYELSMLWKVQISYIMNMFIYHIQYTQDAIVIPDTNKNGKRLIK